MNAAPANLRRRIVPATAAALAVAALAGGAWYGFDAISMQPIRHVSFTGQLERVPPADLEAFSRSVQGAASGGASLEAVRQAARKLPWVREATVRRHFPDTVEISLETHEPLARWGDHTLVSTRGELFSAAYDAFLPKFTGPDNVAPEMVNAYPALREALEPLASALTEVRVSPRGAWQLVLESGLAIDLGRTDMQARLARFVAVWPQLSAQGVATRHADLRYANGFALRKP